MYVTPQLVVNTKYVKPREVSTWRSLVDPKWQGKIVAKDPALRRRDLADRDAST